MKEVLIVNVLERVRWGDFIESKVIRVNGRDFEYRCYLFGRRRVYSCFFFRLYYRLSLSTGSFGIRRINVRRD